MTEKELLYLFRELGVITRYSHFVYTSWRHGRDYFNKDAIYPHTEIVSNLCSMIAKRFIHDGIEVVVAPALGGIVLSQRVAEHLEKLSTPTLVVVGDQPRREVLSVYAEKSGDDGFVIRRGYEKLIPEKKVLVVDDVLTTGGSVKKLVEAVRTLKGEVIGVGTICNRGGVTKESLAVSKLESLVHFYCPSWAEAECQLCAQNIPINLEFGKGREYLDRVGI